MINFVSNRTPLTIRDFRAISMAAGLLCIWLLTACSKTDSSIQKAIEDYGKSQGAKEVVTELVYKDPNSPDKAYASATITHNYADPQGNFQREFLGFILQSDGKEWKINRNTTYTKDEKKAQQLLAGQKVIP